MSLNAMFVAYFKPFSMMIVAQVLFYNLIITQVLSYDLFMAQVLLHHLFIAQVLLHHLLFPVMSQSTASHAQAKLL